MRPLAPDRVDPRQGSIVLVDSSVLVYLVEGEEDSPRRRAAERFLGEAAARGARVVASALAWMEVLAKPIATRDEGLAARYRRLLADSSRVELIVVDVAIAERAATIIASLPPAARRRISQADAIHVATAIEVGASAVLTNDEAWRLVPRCPRPILVDELAAEGSD
jgi:predicted nucleic acid-binding protein